MVSAGVDVVSHSTGTLIFPPQCSQISVGFSLCANNWCPREDVEDGERTGVTRTLQTAPVLWEEMGSWHPVSLECLLQ